MRRTLFTALLAVLVFLSFFGFQTRTAESSEVHDVAVSSVTAWPTFVVPAIDIHINVTVENQGTGNETFDLAVYAGNLTIQTVRVVDLGQGLSGTLTFEWRVFPDVWIMVFPPPWPEEPMVENVTIWAEADVVAGEVDTSDNVYIDGTVTIIWWPPDVDGDGDIDIFDIVSVAGAYGSELGGPGYNPLLDFNQDGKIDIFDIVIMANPEVYGTSYW
ncbi:MAG: CARDB domain-containing protein [Candidatus Bathyarchaeia archaeon]